MPGQKNLGLDAASRHPAGQPDRIYLPGEPPVLDLLSNTTGLAGLSRYEIDTDTAEDSATIAAATAALEAIATVFTWDMVRMASDIFLNPIHYLEVGFPADCRELPADLPPFHRYAVSLCVVDGVVLMGQLIVIPL